MNNKIYSRFYARLVKKAADLGLKEIQASDGKVNNLKPFGFPFLGNNYECHWYWDTKAKAFCFKIGLVSRADGNWKFVRLVILEEV